jgi:hypothetical protein
MLTGFARLALVVLTLGLFPGVARAGEPSVPSWIRNYPAAKTVAMEIVADWNHQRLPVFPAQSDDDEGLCRVFTTELEAPLGNRNHRLGRALQLDFST